MYVNMSEYVCVCVHVCIGGVDKSKDKALQAELHGFCMDLFLFFGLSFFGAENPVVSAV